MSDHTFRFGMAAMPDGAPERWVATARRAEALGYSTLLMPEGVMPDGRRLLAPFPAATRQHRRNGRRAAASPRRLRRVLHP
jgi:alkanesulfonate monooxygenase SsuD/methylene tetrahydromethanopterin reductase-like flavin-dependent oxidoreductase (luciferase family)